MCTRACPESRRVKGRAHDRVGVDDEDVLLGRARLLQPVQDSHRLVDAAASRISGSFNSLKELGNLEDGPHTVNLK